MAVDHDEHQDSLFFFNLMLFKLLFRYLIY